jgi:hypothetical protein
MSVRFLLYTRKFIAPEYHEILQFYVQSILLFTFINILLLSNMKYNVNLSLFLV